MEGVDDSLGGVSDKKAISWVRVRRTMDVGCTEANQMAMSSWAMPVGVRWTLLLAHSRRYWMQSFYAGRVTILIGGEDVRVVEDVHVWELVSPAL